MLHKNRIVVKVGTSTLTNELGNSKLRSFEDLALVLSDVQNMGYEVVLVSSGAIAIGANKMHLKEKPTDMRMKQAAAAVGQCSNMFLYDKFFGYYDKTVAQILFNSDDIHQEEKKENLANTFNALLENGVMILSATRRFSRKSGFSAITTSSLRLWQCSVRPASW